MGLHVSCKMIDTYRRKLCFGGTFTVSLLGFHVRYAAFSLLWDSFDEWTIWSFLSIYMKFCWSIFMSLLWIYFSLKTYSYTRQWCYLIFGKGLWRKSLLVSILHSTVFFITWMNVIFKCWLTHNVLVDNHFNVDALALTWLHGCALYTSTFCT